MSNKFYKKTNRLLEPDNSPLRFVFVKIINEMNFPNYFLVVYDFIKYAKNTKFFY